MGTKTVYEPPRRPHRAAVEGGTGPQLMESAPHIASICRTHTFFPVEIPRYTCIDWGDIGASEKYGELLP